MLHSQCRSQIDHAVPFKTPAVQLWCSPEPVTSDPSVACGSGVFAVVEKRQQVAAPFSFHFFAAVIAMP
jgi:hypothetical protein